MTTTGISNQGEGSGGAEHRPYRGEAVRWTRTHMWPASCLKIEVVVHQGAPDGTWCLAIEASNPHTKELLAKWLDPAMPTQAHVTVALRTVAEIRAVIQDLLDPDPF